MDMLKYLDKLDKHGGTDSSHVKYIGDTNQVYESLKLPLLSKEMFTF